MGGKSKSSSSNANTTNTTTQTETRNNALSNVDEGAVGVSGEGNVITVVDGGAFDLAQHSTSASMDLVRDVISGAGGLLESLAENQVEVLGGANALAGAAIANMASASGAEPVEVTPPMTEKTKIYLGFAAAGAVAVTAWAWGNKK